MFALFIAAAMLLDETLLLRCKTDYQHHAHGIRKMLLICTGILISLILPKLLWKNHLVITQASRQFSAPIDWNKLFLVLIGKDDSYQKTVLLNYLRTILVDGFAILNENLFLTLPVLCLLLLAGLLWIHQQHCKNNVACKQSRVALIWIAGIQTSVYILGLCVMYMFKFSEYEAVHLASFQRYCSVALTAVQVFLVLLVFSYIAKRTVNWVCVLLVATAFSLIPGGSLLQFINRSSIQDSYKIQLPHKETAMQTLEITGTDFQKIYIVSQASNGFDYYMLKFNLRPCIVNQDGWSLSPTGPLSENDLWTKTLSAAEWQEELKSFDYVLLNHVDETFIDHYGALFEQTEAIQDQAVFSVNPETGLLSLDN